MLPWALCSAVLSLNPASGQLHVALMLIEQAPVRPAHHAGFDIDLK